MSRRRELAAWAAIENVLEKVENLPTDPADASDITAAIAAAVAKIDTIDAFHDVPTADVATNTSLRDVVGNKSDTTSGTSLVALVKVLTAALVTVDGLIDQIHATYPRVFEKTINCAQTAGTYDIATAAGDVVIEDFTLYVTTVGATFDSVSIQTNDTTAYEVLTVVEGAVANVDEGRNFVPASKGISFRLANLKKLQYTLAGATGTGELKLTLKWRPVSVGGNIA